MKLLVGQARQKLIRAWSIFFPIIFMWILGQLIFGKFAGYELHLLLWFSVLVLLPFLLLFLGGIIEKYPNRLINRGAYLLLWYVSLLYLLLVLLTKFAEGLALQYNASFGDTGGSGLIGYLNLSYIWLLPFDLLLVVGFYFYLYYDNQNAQSKEQAYKTIAKANAVKWQAKGNEDKKRWGELIAKGQLEKALEEITGFLKTHNSSYYDQVLLIKNRLHTLQMDTLGERISYEDATVSRNKIIANILYILDKA